jgi:acyl-CoA thioesterase I
MANLLSRWLLALLLSLPGLSLAADADAILVFGDSLSAGYGLPQGKGWANLLQRRLQEQGYEYRVVNASISGETTLGGRNRLARALGEHHPQIVIIELGANDALRGQPLDTMSDNLTYMVRTSQATKAKVIVIGMRIPPNYGPDYTEKFHASFAQVAKANHAELVPFMFDGFGERRQMFQSDGLHPSIEAQGLILDNVWKVLKPLLHKPPQKG